MLVHWCALSPRSRSGNVEAITLRPNSLATSESVHLLQPLSDSIDGGSRPKSAQVEPSKQPSKSSGQPLRRGAGSRGLQQTYAATAIYSGTCDTITGCSAYQSQNDCQQAAASYVYADAISRRLFQLRRPLFRLPPQTQPQRL
ncbi:hypothetical protein CYMTET_36079 [Cymbomonas tetramitiformis]|uniref:Uncharacterized protein n=1 Tax=Cymbomonas tetramitiformis TaxID=36881 RepID=A0AAE0F7Z5_9CHLO|nr:hypothetical protein CYMTET_36079 [Cymbomonas tetramitiformis]